MMTCIDRSINSLYLRRSVVAGLYRCMHGQQIIVLTNFAENACIVNHVMVFSIIYIYSVKLHTFATAGNLNPVLFRTYQPENGQTTLPIY